MLASLGNFLHPLESVQGPAGTSPGVTPTPTSPAALVPPRCYQSANHRLINPPSCSGRMGAE